MPRIKPIDPATATGDAKTALDGVKGALGAVPNIFATLAHAPRALEGFLAFNGSLARGTLPARLREQIALAVAGANGCDYCASAHGALGRRLGLDDEEVARNLEGEAADTKTATVLGFVRQAVIRRGRLDEADVDALRTAGFGDGEVVEILAHIGVNMFTNYFNHIADTEIDFPPVRASARAQAA